MLLQLDQTIRINEQHIPQMNVKRTYRQFLQCVLFELIAHTT